MYFVGTRGVEGMSGRGLGVPCGQRGCVRQEGGTGGEVVGTHGVRTGCLRTTTRHRPCVGHTDSVRRRVVCRELTGETSVRSVVRDVVLLP